MKQSSKQEMFGKDNIWICFQCAAVISTPSQ